MKKILYPFIALVCLVVALFILGSTPFVLDIARQKAQSALQKGTNLPITIGSLSGNLFYALEIRDVNVDSIVVLHKGRASYSALKLLSNQIEIRDLLIEGLSVDIDRLGEIRDSLQKVEKGGEFPFTIQIAKASLKNSEAFGIVNNKRLAARIFLKGAATAERAIIDTLIIRTDSSTVSAHGIIPLTDTIPLNVQYSIDLLLQELGQTNLSGSIECSGTIHGNRREPIIDNQAAFQIAYNEDDVSGTAEIHWHTPLLDSLSLEADIEARTRTLSLDSIEEQSWQARISAQRKKFTCTVLSSYGTVKIDGSAQGNLNNPRIAAHISGTLKYGQLEPRVQADMTFRDQLLALTTLTLRDSAIYMKASATISTKIPETVSADLMLECNDVTFLNSFLDKEHPIQGEVYVDAHARGTINNPDIITTVNIQDAIIYGEKIIQADLEAAITNQVLLVNKGSILSPRGSLSITGEYDLIKAAFSSRVVSESLTLSAPEIIGKDTIPISGKVGLDVSLHGTSTNLEGNGTVTFKDFVYDSLLLEDHELDINITNNIATIFLENDRRSLNLEAQLGIFAPHQFSGELTLNDFNLKHYLPIDTGSITATITARGNMTNLEKTAADITINRLYGKKDQYEIESADSLIIALRQGIIGFTTCRMNIQQNIVTIQGVLPLDIVDDRFDVQCTAQDIDLATLTAMVPEAPDMHGHVSFDINAQGTFERPQITGEINVSNARYTGQDIAFDSVQSLMTLAGNQLTINYLNGKVNNGVFNISGNVAFGDRKIRQLALDATVKKADFQNRDLGTYLVSGDLNAYVQNDTIQIRGEIVADSATYDVPFNFQRMVKLITASNQPPREQSEILHRIHCDVGISAPNGVNIKNNVADVNADVDLQMRGFLSKINIYGNVATPEGGTIAYLNRKFDIVNATIQFDDPYRINPVLDFVAETHVSSVDGEYNITLSVTGTVEKWKLELLSNPMVPEQDIISLILIGRRRTSMALQDETVDLSSTAQAYAAAIARGAVEVKTQQALGLEKVEITGEVGGEEELSVDIEKKLGKGFTLVYGTGIETWEMQKIGLNYDINDRFSILTLYDQKNLNTSVDLDINFKIK